METRKLGADLSVSALGLGCMGMSEFYGATDETEALATIDRSLELGVNFMDTADIYGMGANEELLAKALKNRRSQFVVATKFGLLRDPAKASLRGLDGSAAYVRKACDASLKRLGIETIDLYYLHRVDPATPIEETVGAMADLVTAGKVRYLGLSEAAEQTVRRAHKVHAISAVQSEYSLWSRDVEPVLPTLRELNIGFVPYSPLGRGFLTGAITNQNELAQNDFRRSQPRFQGEAFDHNMALVNKLQEMATSRSCEPGQLAIAWLLAQGDNIVPIPGTKRRKYLEQNIASCDVTMTADDLADIDKIISHEKVVGDRYPDMSFLTRN